MKKLKAKTKKQAVKKQPTKSGLVKVTIELNREVANKLKNVSGITNRTYKEIVDQALRGLFGMAIPTIKEQIEGEENER